MSVRERLLRYGVRGKSERMRVERAKMYKRERGGTASFLLLTYLFACSHKKKTRRKERKMR